MHLLKTFINNAKNNNILIDESILTDTRPNFYCINLQGKLIDCNEYQVETFGYSQLKDILGVTVFDMVPHEIASLYDLNNQEVLATAKTKISIEPVPVMNSNSETVNYASYKLPLRNRINKTIGIIGVSIPVAKNKFSHIKIPNNVKLTLKQQECLHYLAKGMTMKQIARELNISHRTVEHRIESIKYKLNCYSKLELLKKIWE